MKLKKITRKQLRNIDFLIAAITERQERIALYKLIRKKDCIRHEPDDELLDEYNIDINTTLPYIIQYFINKERAKK